MTSLEPYEHDSDTGSSNSRSNWLRAGILGANDGIISLAALVIGVAGASTASSALLIIGISGLIAGALSMAIGEYVSVSSQRDIEKAALHEERFKLENYPKEELEELVAMYEKKGLTPGTARAVAVELTAKDPYAAHFDVELGINPNDLTNPRHAAFASGISFTSGAIIPLIAIIIPPVAYRVPVTFGAVFVALCLTGFISANLSGTNKLRATTRIVLGGILAMIITYGIGTLFAGSVQ